MNWKEVMGLVSTIAFFIPILIILFLRLQRFKCFLALGIYYLMGFCNNMMTLGFIPVTAEFKRVFGIACNLIDAPLMFIFLGYFFSAPNLVKRIRISILLFFVFELVVILMKGYNKNSVTVIMAPGLVAVFFFSGWFFIRQLRFALLNNKATGKALMLSSIFFVYGCYTLMYIMYYILQTEAVSDVFIMYFISTSISSLLLSFGILVENKRIRKLQELKIARKELSMLYGNRSGKIAPPEIFFWDDSPFG